MRTALIVAGTLALSACQFVTDDVPPDASGGSGGSGGAAGSGGTGQAGSGGGGGSAGEGGSGGIDTSMAFCDILPAGRLDPNPPTDSPGKYRESDSSPDTTADPLAFDAGDAISWHFAGRVLGTICPGVYYARASGGQELGGRITTLPNGSFGFTTPLFCGPQVIKMAWGSPYGKLVVVFAVKGPACAEPDLRLTLSWDQFGQDWEMHLIRPGGHINDQAGGSDCTWTTCISSHPDWGPPGPEGDPYKDIDFTGTSGTENIGLPSLEPGTYTVMIEHWGQGDPKSSGQLVLNVLGETTAVPIEHLAPKHVRTVATVDGETGAVTPMDSDYDCTASWSGGCTAPLP